MDFIFSIHLSLKLLLNCKCHSDSESTSAMKISRCLVNKLYSRASLAVWVGGLTAFHPSQQHTHVHLVPVIYRWVVFFPLPMEELAIFNCLGLSLWFPRLSSHLLCMRRVLSFASSAEDNFSDLIQPHDKTLASATLQTHTHGERENILPSSV